MIEENIYTFLSTNAAIDAASTGAYFFHLPQSVTYPCIAYGMVGENRQTNFDGQTGLIESFIEINCFSKVFSEARSLSNVIETELNGFTGAMSGSRVDLTELTDSIGFYESETGLYGVRNGYTIWHR